MLYLLIGRLELYFLLYIFVLFVNRDWVFLKMFEYETVAGSSQHIVC